VSEAAAGKEAGMTQKALLLCGLLSPLLYAFADGLAGALWGSYSFQDQTISELGAVGAPFRGVFTALLVPVYLLLIAFGIGVWHSGLQSRALKTAGTLLVVLGILALAVGVFVPMQPRGSVQGVTGMLHLLEGGAAMFIVFAAMGFAAAALGRRFRIYTVSTVFLMLVFLVWTVTESGDLEAGLPTPWLGVIERIWWYGYQLWFAALALTLLRQNRMASR